MRPVLFSDDLNFILMSFRSFNFKNAQDGPGLYANILLDHWFKRSFGSEPYKRLLELFLQELIPERKIASLSFAPQEHLNPDPDKKDVRVDVECTDSDGSRFVVEMQLARQNFFYERAVYNTTFGIQKQIPKGERSYNFPTVYFIGIMDFSIHEGSDEVLYRYSLKEDKSGEIMTDAVHFIFLELPNCRKALTPEATAIDNFSYALHNMSKFAEIPDVMSGELFTLLFDSAKISNFAPDEKAKYEKDMTTERDRYNQLEYARQEGIEKGLQEGISQEKKETARRMLTDGMEINLIAKYTGLSSEELSHLS